MKNRLMMIAIALLASLTCLPASAQSGPGTGGTNDMGPDMGPGTAQQGKTPRVRAPRDCSQAPNLAGASYKTLRTACYIAAHE